MSFIAVLSPVFPGCYDTHSISPVNDGGSLFFLYLIHIYVFGFFVKENMLFDILDGTTKSIFILRKYCFQPWLAAILKIDAILKKNKTGG